MNSNLVTQWGRRASVMGLMAIMVMSALAADGFHDDTWNPLVLGTDGVSSLRNSDPLYLITKSGKYYLTDDAKCIHVRPDNTVSSSSKPIEVTIDLNGHSVSNIGTTTYQLIKCGQNNYFNITTTCTLTNSSTKVSYLDGLNKDFEGSGRGILNNYSGIFHLGGKIVIRRCRLDKPKEEGVYWWGAGICNHGTFYMTGGDVGEAATADKNGVCNYCPNKHGGGIYNGQATLTQRTCTNQTKFVMTGGSVQYCKAGTHGGGLSNQFWDSLLVVGGEGDGVVISHNESPSGAGIMTGNRSILILTNNVEISHNKATGTVPADTLSGGGISVGSGGNTNQLYIYNCNIVSNSAANLGGGGIYMRGVKAGKGMIEMYGGRIAYNTTTGVGGGIHTQGPVLLAGGVIESNTSDSNGGGVCIDKDSGTDDDWDQSFTMTGGCIRNNTAQRGGGVYTVNEVAISGGDITNNNASLYGGGVCIDQTQKGTEIKPFTLSGGTIADNVAKLHGGGFYVNLASKGKVRLENGVVMGNKAGEQGGGFWYSGVATTNLVAGGTLVSNNLASVGGGFYAQNKANLVVDGGTIVDNVATNGGGGGFYVTGSSLVLSGGTVKQNEAQGKNGNGGGFYVNQSAVSLRGNVDIESNQADGNGGGLAVLCNASTHEITLEGGTVAGNIATNGNGGGFWISGKGSEDSKITSAIDVYGNEAKNGGGFYLNTNAYFTVDGGFVYDNKAVGDPAADFNTAYKGGNGSGTPEGVGGGFYLASGTPATSGKNPKPAIPTVLRFTLSPDEAIGIFANTADCAADDVAAEGVNTEVQNMPEVDDMVLDKLAGAVVTGWDEDYRKDDDCYTNGTVSVTNIGYKAERYRTVVARGDDPIVASNLVTGVGNTETRYLCLTLGYNFPIPEQLWITDHEDLGNGVVNLQFRPCFSNENQRTLYISEWARAAVEGGNLWVVWGKNEQELLANCDDIQDGTNGMHVVLREKDPVDNDAKRIWVRTPFFTNWTHSASSETNRFYKIVVTDLRENIRKNKDQASK